jgi:hypothetical protein
MLLFKDLKQNYPVFMLDTNSFVLQQGRVTQVSFPRVEMNPKSGKTEMVVDITIEAGGKTATYTMPDNISMTYAENMVLATDRACLVGEVEAQKANAEQVLASVPRARDIIDKSQALLAELNPVYKEKCETETRFNKIEESIEGMAAMVRSQREMLEKFIEGFKS